MQNAVLHHFYDAKVVIRFTNRAPQMLFNKESFNWIQETVNSEAELPMMLPRTNRSPRADIIELDQLKLSPQERAALSKACPYFPTSYLDYLSSMRLDPVKQVKMTFVPKGDDGQLGEIECAITGLWRDCILYEVPIMSISELQSGRRPYPGGIGS